jgi:hypothetical protein
MKLSRSFLLTLAVVCWLGWTLATAEAQVPPTSADVVQESDIVEPETPSPWSLGLLTSTLALTIGGVSAVLGIWVRRDEKRPIVNAIAMSALVVSAVCVGITQGYLDAVSAIRHAEDLDRMLGMVDEIALESGDPALAELVRSERGPAAVAPPPGQ